MTLPLYAGTYCAPEFLQGSRGFLGRAKGAYRLAFDNEAGTLALDAVWEGIANPSFLTLSADGTRLYCVHEVESYRGEPGGAVSAYTLRADGDIAHSNTRPTLGGDPCHVALSPDGGLLCATNYSGGSVCVLPVQKDGSLGEGQIIRHSGSGPARGRQDTPHPHSSIFLADGRLLVADLGADMLTVYPVQSGVPDVAQALHTRTEPGAGPRMCVLDHARHRLYVACELSCRLEVYDCGDQGVWQRLYSLPLLPEGTQGPGDTAAHLALSADGRFLYASARGQDRLCVFSLTQRDEPTLLQALPSGGRTPRAFALSPCGRWLVCAGQNSDTLHVFAIDAQKGTLSPGQVFSLPSPVCLAFAPNRG